MAPPAHKSILERSENVLMSPWKGKLIVQDRMLCDIALWSTYGAMIPTQLPQELDFKYVMKVSSLKKRLPEAAFRKQNYLEEKVCFQDLCFNLYEVELSNRQGENIDKLTECIKNKQLAIIKCLEDRGFFILLTSSALLSEPDFGGKQMGLHGLHLFRSPLSTGVKDLKVEDDISMKVIPILSTLNCALLETKKSLPEERIHPNTLVKRHFQELYKADRSPSLSVAPQDRMKDPTFLGKLPSGFDLIPPAEKCPSESLTQLNSYFSDPSAYILEVSTALDLLAEHPQSPCVSDGICDAGFSLVMTPDPEFLVSEAEVRKETETKKDSEEMLKAVCSLQKETPLPVSLPSDKTMVMEALSLAKSSSHLSPSEEVRCTQDFLSQTQSLLGLSSEGLLELTQVEVDSSSASTTLGRQCSLNCISSGCHTSGDSLELRKNHKNGPNTENMNLEAFDSVFIKQTSLSVSREVSLELSEEDSDIDLALTISPPTSPREEMPAGEIEQFEEAPFSNLELQDVAEEIGEPEEVALTESREVSSADNVSVYPSVSEEPVENKERKGDNLQPVTLILSKENCTLEIAEEINVTSDFPFDSVIEEVSPASSPEPPVPVKETRPYQAVTPCILKLHGTQCEKSNQISQCESEDLGITEKENVFVGPTHPVGQDNFTQVQQMQVSAEMPLILTDHPGRTGRPTLPGKVTEEIVSSEHDEGLSFSGKVQCYGRELNQPASAAKCTGDFSPSPEKLVKSGNPLQPVSIENRNLDLKHLVLESSEPPFGPRNVIENKSLSDTLVSTTAPSGIVNVSVKQQTSPKSSQNHLFPGDLKTDEGIYLQVKSLTAASVDGAYSTQGCMCSVVPTLCSSSDNATLTHYVRPINAEPVFQAQEIPAGRMASLLKNGEPEAELHKETTGPGTAGPQSNTTSSLKGERKAIHTLQDVSTCETKELLNVGVSSLCAGPYQNTADTKENLSKEPLASFVSESFDTSVCGIATEHVEIENSGEGLRAEAGSETLGRDGEVGVNSDMHYELSGDSDLDLLGDCRNPRLDLEDSYTLRGSYTRKKDVPTDGYESSLNFHNNNQEDWGCSSWVPGMETSLPPGHWTAAVKKEEKCVPPYVQIRDLHGILRTYANFSITKELKDTMRTSHGLRRHPSFSANCGLPSSWTSTWQVADDLTQNTLDLEYLRFAHKLKQTIKNGDSQHSASSANVFPKESPTQISIGAFPSTKISEAPFLHPAPRSRSPLLVTVVESDPRPQGQPRRGYTASSLDSSSSWRERCSHNRDLRNSQRNHTVSFHLNKLKYNSTVKESRNDISLILNEYAEFNKVMKNSNQFIFQDKELNDVSGEATAQEMYLPFPGRSASYEDIIIDVCTNLHVKLRSVVKEACKSTFLFYLVETEDKSFFVRTKNLLRKGGHTEIEPQHFCQAFHRENDTLIIIIRNEDISSHLHQIPSLLKLKHFPSVIFAGVDSPGDVLDHTYQELFRAGGFVISDDKILEAVTLVQLKEIIKILEKLNGNGRWKWLLHYRENKKLKEDERVDSTAHKKNIMLKSFQSANIIELLHYHQCDSRSSTKAEILKCLLNLQIQHIDARFAVLLTDKPTIPREVFENSGILVTDVNNFIENIEKIAAPFRSSYW
uniref:Isoform 2 of Protein TASOR 2 n=1 Tax=Homo sapiens TaxID=9606 RepID=Q5VWN6-2